MLVSLVNRVWTVRRDDYSMTSGASAGMTQRLEVTQLTLAPGLGSQDHVADQRACSHVVLPFSLASLQRGSLTIVRFLTGQLRTPNTSVPAKKVETASSSITSLSSHTQSFPSSLIKHSQAHPQSRTVCRLT